MNERMTQRDLLFGIYRAKKGAVNPGINIWFNGRYVWPRKRAHGKLKPKAVQLPSEVNDGINSRPADAEVPMP